MRLTWKIATVSILMVLCGCAGFKGKPSLEVNLPQRFQQQPAANTPARLQYDWWRHTNDTTLLSTIRAIDSLNLSLEQAQLRLKVARLESQKYDHLPSLTAATGAQYDRLLEGDAAIGSNVNAQSGGKKTTGYYNARLDASWEMPIYRQLGDAADIANANIVFAKADIVAIRTSVISEAIRLYANMRRLQQELTQCEAILTSAQKIVEYQKIKHKAGLVTDGELGASQQLLLIAQIEIQRAENEKIGYMHQLATLLGAVAPDDAWKTLADIPSFDVPAFDDTPLDVLRNRPDIRKAEASVFAAAGEFELSKSELYPKLTLSGSLSQLGNLTGNPLMGKIVQLTGISTLALPLFDWGQRLSAARIKDEQLSERASAYRETVIGAMNEVEQFWSAYRMAQKVEESTEENTQIARSDSDHTALLFKQGISSGIEAETAAINAADATITELQARADTITKLTALTKALGGASVSHTNEDPDD